MSEHENAAAVFELEPHVLSVEEEWIDEPLPRLSLGTQYVQVTLELRGKGEPRLDFEVEVDPCEKEQPAGR